MNHDILSTTKDWIFQNLISIHFSHLKKTLCFIWCGVGYILLMSADYQGNSLGILWKFYGNSLGIFCGIFWEFFGISLGIWKNWFVCKYFGFCQDFVSIKKEGWQEFRSLEVQRKLIALKNCTWCDPVSCVIRHKITPVSCKIINLLQVFTVKKSLIFNCL